MAKRKRRLKLAPDAIENRRERLAKTVSKLTAKQRSDRARKGHLTRKANLAKLTPEKQVAEARRRSRISKRGASTRRAARTFSFAHVGAEKDFAFTVLNNPDVSEPLQEAIERRYSKLARPGSFAVVYQIVLQPSGEVVTGPRTSRRVPLRSDDFGDFESQYYALLREIMDGSGVPGGKRFDSDTVQIFVLEVLVYPALRERKRRA